MSKGNCIIDDDFEKIYKQLVDADVIVLVTPVYWHDMSENLKCLLDRTGRCETGHNSFLQNKKCLVFAYAGGTGYGAIECLHNLEQTIGHMGMSANDRLPVIQFNKHYMLPALSEAGRAIINI